MRNPRGNPAFPGMNPGYRPGTPVVGRAGGVPLPVTAKAVYCFCFLRVVIYAYTLNISF